MITINEFVLEKNASNDLSARKGINFELPPELEAIEPPEARGLTRDQVRLMVSHYRDDKFQHTLFSELPVYLNPGDILVVNTSGTLKAALIAKRSDDVSVEFHLSTLLPAGLWIIELRRITRNGTEPFLFAQAGEELTLPGGGSAHLLTPYDQNLRINISTKAKPVRLWIAILDLPCPLLEYLDRFGFPIRYKYIQKEWPIEYYQNVYSSEPGSVEMPSAGRAFTPELINRLVANGVQVESLILHTGVGSLESHESPHEEYYRVPYETANHVNSARLVGKRVIAVGTTVVRALETVVDPQGLVHPANGWTNRIIQSDQKLQTVDGLLTGFHEPHASHLAILAALAGYSHLQRAYWEALVQGYLWHEFGDLHLILP